MRTRSSASASEKAKIAASKKIRIVIQAQLSDEKVKSQWLVHNAADKQGPGVIRALFFQGCAV